MTSFAQPISDLPARAQIEGFALRDATCKKALSEATRWLYREVQNLLPSDLRGKKVSISEKGAECEGRTIAIGRVWKQYCEKAASNLIKMPDLPDPKEVNEAAPDLTKQNRATVRYRFVEPNPEEEIEPLIQRYDQYKDLTEPEIVAAETRLLAEKLGKPFDPSKEATDNTLLGVRMGMAQRNDYEMGVTLEEDMQTFFNRDTFSSKERFYRNSPTTPGGVTASFNRFADTVTLARKIEAEDGSSDLYTGRADTYEKGIELARFMFLSELQSGDKQKGITQNRDGSYTFTFLTQSLLSLAGAERKMLEKEIEVYKRLRQEGEQRFTHKGREYRVLLNPLPIAATNFNFMNMVEALVPDRFSGKKFGDELTLETDLRLDAYHLISGNNPNFAPVSIALNQLKDPTLKPWQQVMLRAYICHLLNIPINVHCKSSVDRTNVAAAMIVAMKQWLLSGKEIPEGGILEIVNVTHQGQDGREFCPFKELFAYALTKGLIIPRFARYDKGYKLGQGSMQHRALHDLLPARYLEDHTTTTLKRIGIWILLFIVNLFTFGLCTKSLFYSSACFPKKLIKESYREAGERSVLHGAEKRALKRAKSARNLLDRQESSVDDARLMAEREDGLFADSDS